MFHRMVSAARNKWYNSENCTVNNLVEYIIQTGQMRDAQIEAIKTYLFLKIGCENKSLEYLFKNGVFNNLNLNDIELSGTTRTFLENAPAAAALFEYAVLTDNEGNQVSESLEKQIRKDPENINYNEFFRNAFYGVTYTDYLFSLPMGSGKTYLMAAFIYLDLYFAMMEPLNPAFAHNFIIFAPSGLKSSVVPSLKTIKKFNPGWIIPEPSASDIKRKIIFEVLDQSKTANKSNKTKNPNVQKIANHQPFSDLFGLVMVTNAEKVILDRIKEKNGQIIMFEESDDDKDRQANELRSLIGKLPSLSVFIDEVHHAVSDEIKLRAVVNKWATNNNINSVVGFSGTPYLEKAEKITVTDKLVVATAEISNIVYYYPLLQGIGNFLKRPIVKIADIADSSQIIEKGVHEFLNYYKDTVYDGELVSKLGIYCGSIHKLEEVVYPLVSRIVAQYGLSADTILRFHKGNKQYPQPADSQMKFDTLDKSFSKIRIVLLVQIGKEGWDCRSLTGIILSQEGDCPKNMVLQTSCRCLRQVEKDKHETALIYLNESNAKKLNDQLQQQHHISLIEFTSADNSKTTLKRFDRTAYLKLPKVQFYQLKIKYETLVIDTENDTEHELKNATNNAERSNIIITTDFEMKNLSTEVLVEERGNIFANFTSWLYGISKTSFGFITMMHLNEYSEILKDVFDTITFEKDGSRFYSSKYNRTSIEANIRKAFYEKRSVITTEELIPCEANLLNIGNFNPEINTNSPQDYYPEQKTVENIILDDKNKLKIKPEVLQAIKTLEDTGNTAIADTLRRQHSSHPAKNRSFHYLPYKTDSGFEKTFLQEILSMPEIEKLNLEVYYNGDRSLTEFKIRCYKTNTGRWKYIGMYTPDFLIIQRKNTIIHKAIIVETKGEIYASNPTFADKRIYMDTEFKKQNNNAFGYKRFEYLYLEDSLPEKERILKTHQTIGAFFKEDN
ncbi:DEAD/DEAH box helicase family protein [Paenibacillus oenotherae]|uniref:DEAD/DEAH box helicase family protein n=1 Tax=Paenibacillus oenotherae TaxID=1435645 RepID=A0ABS7DAA3_9BACL|nr:DEAD/DEAH box helicase family protein [Paenibacillus oenotherae]MBW7476683.1 DEAD/DEAH box helicase family protein [Paenibacillus oenotherae]